MLRRLVGASLLMACVIGLSAGTAFAQSANIGGVVTDDTGGALPGVTVTITNKNNGATQVLVTGPEGNFRAIALQPAPYTVTAEISGFGSAKRDITLTVGAELTLDLKLGVAQLEETLTVTGDAPLVEVAKAAPSSVVTADQVQSLPVLSRNFLVLAQLLPGAAPYTGYKFAVTKFGGVADQRNGFTTLITALSAAPYCASNVFRYTLNSCTASCVMLIVGLPQIASSTPPPSMSVVKPLR